jgi:putative ribosome biogenesis GTPase RsgA
MSSDYSYLFNNSNDNSTLYEQESPVAFHNLREEDDEIYSNILLYHQTMVDNIDELNELVDGRVVLAVGATGVGKSTLMNAIL